MSAAAPTATALEIFEMVCCGQLNKVWVRGCRAAGVSAVGLSGLDGRIFEEPPGHAAHPPQRTAHRPAR
ncbi:MAG: hypothetical protein R2856_30875 [Caldilineaceae bacterium]